MLFTFKMETDNNHITSKNWSNLKKILERSGPFCTPGFDSSPDILDFITKDCKVLVVGAGGLGCELLKDLVMMGFCNIHIIDMDTIDLSNLNRQFLFRRENIGQSKAEVAAEYIKYRVPSCNVVPHYCKIEDYDDIFYRQFNIIISGLDSIVARRWINGIITSLLVYDEDGELDQSSVIPLIDGGTEGFKGNVRVILPGITPCIECTLDLFPPQVTYPLCTIATTPRLPEHCIEYVKLLQWPKENPFNVPIDGDDPSHLNWICEKAVDRASQFGITGVTYRLVQGVVKNIIPAVASTNAVIAAACVTEAFKLATNCYSSLNNYMIFNDVDGIYTYTYEAERKPNCLACSPNPALRIEVQDGNVKLQQLLSTLCDGHEYQMKSPALTAQVNGKSRTLYMSTVASIEQMTRDNLKKSLNELGLDDGSEINVTDPTSPNSLSFILRYTAA